MISINDLLLENNVQVIKIFVEAVSGSASTQIVAKTKICLDLFRSKVQLVCFKKKITVDLVSNFIHNLAPCFRQMKLSFFREYNQKMVAST